MPSKPSKPIEKLAPIDNFEDALRELEQVVAQLEEGGVPLETSLEMLQRGLELANRCEKVLGEAELTLQKLAINEEGELELEEVG